MTEETMIPTYGLEDWDFKISSTPAMLAQLLKNRVITDENLAGLENVMFSDDHVGGENLDDANISPQMSTFNQAGLSGVRETVHMQRLWGRGRWSG